MSFGRLSPLARAQGSRRARLRLAAAVSVPVLLSVTLAACGGGDDSTASTDPTDASSTAGLVNLNAEWPLTGETMDGDAPDHPVYVVKIDNTYSSEPQIGLDKADMVVEELVEGGLTRLAVFFYSEIPDNVGPVRSMRASDVGIVKPVNANLVASGAARITMKVIDGAHIQTFTEDSSGAGFYRDSSRVAPYNLFNHLQDLADKPGKSWEAPDKPYMKFGSASDFKGTMPVKTIGATFSGAHTTSWQWNGKMWIRPDSYAETGHDFQADNVLLLRVKVGDAGYVDPAGNPVPETEFYGTGQGLLVSGNKAQKVTWSKKDKAAQLMLTNKHGDPVDVPAGHTWIELVPQTGGSVQLGH
jgi:hypothetical protein